MNQLIFNAFTYSLNVVNIKVCLDTIRYKVHEIFFRFLHFNIKETEKKYF